MKNLQKRNRGFTLIELMTALSLFIIIMTMSMGSILGIFDANRRSKSIKAIMSNLNITIETMSKEMRYGTNYHCGSGGTLTTPQNCASGDTFMSFLSSDNTQIIYRLTGTTIEKKIDSDDYLPVTAPEVTIDSLIFYTLGAGTNNTLQPKVILKIKGHAGADDNRSDFILETMVSQRAWDI